MLLQAILIGLWTGLCGIDQFDFLELLFRPIVSGLVIGLILGDVRAGLIVGGSLELVYVGLVPLAGAQPPNIVVGGVIGISLAIILKLPADQAIGISFPFAVLAQLMTTLLFTLFSPLMHRADKYAEELNTSGITYINMLQLLIRFILWGGIAFAVIYFGAEKAQVIVSHTPEKLIHGFGVAGKMMTAIGFALLLNIMLKREYIPFLIIGFIMAAYLKLSILPIALIGLAIAMYDYSISNKGGSGKKAVREEYEDGI